MYSLTTRIHLQQQAETVVNDMLCFTEVEPEVQQQQFSWLTLPLQREVVELAKANLERYGFNLS